MFWAVVIVVTWLRADTCQKLNGNTFILPLCSKILFLSIFTVSYAITIHCKWKLDKCAIAYTTLVPPIHAKIPSPWTYSKTVALVLDFLIQSINPVWRPIFPVGRGSAYRLFWPFLEKKMKTKQNNFQEILQKFECFIYMKSVY